MSKIVNVRFRSAGKTYRFSCDGYTLHVGDSVMVKTEQGLDLAHVCDEPYEADIDTEAQGIVPIKGIATEADIKQYEDKCRSEKEALAVCAGFVEKRGLQMNLVDCVISEGGKKITFFFTADGRVDFRELVKDLASSFRSRIELRQIGSRDEARLIGGIGMCGRELCCCTFLNHFATVNLKLARSQGLSLNPGKLNGACGRLMCCLQFEKEAYDDAHSRLPVTGKKIRTPEGVGIVSDVNYIEEVITVKFPDDNDVQMNKYPWASLEPLNPNLSQGGKCGSCPMKSKHYPDDVSLEDN